MIFSLDVCRARKGDCLLLHFGSKNEPGLAMIDGGPKNVYAPHLKPRLQQIRQARGLTKQQPLPVDLLMVSHVDDDHIQGILDLTKEMIEAQLAGQPLPLRVFSFWHNSFDDIIGNTPDELQAMMKSQFGTASVSGELPEDATIDLDDDTAEELPHEEIVRDNLKVLASIEQGHRLRHDADRLEFPLNPEFDGGLILARADAEPVEFGSGLKFTVIGPMQPELKELQEKHDAWLRDRDKKKSAAAALAAYIDKSVANLSSIVLLAEVAGKRMLLTGDARGDKILEGLELTGVVQKGGSIHVDLLKVPHHGSANNLDLDFFQRITADHYVFSGDGEHGNPEREALEMLFDARGNEAFVMHFTYPIDGIDKEREKDWNKEQRKEQGRLARAKEAAKKRVKVRADWSPERNSLAAFFASRGVPNPKQRIEVVEASKPHVIDLLDAVKF